MGGGIRSFRGITVMDASGGLERAEGARAAMYSIVILPADASERHSGDR
jgi:hypothetical protein